jgi:methionyl-tRNA formyltransferase
LKVLVAEMVESVDADGSQPGDVLAWDGDGPTVAAGAGAIRLIEVKPEGRKAMAGSAYMRGRQQLQRME